jgi:hypothetical protein
MKSEMLPKQTVVRTVALLLLLFAAVDLFAIDLFAPSLCTPATTSDSESPIADEDDCFCCCGHMEVSGVVRVIPIAAYSSDELLPVVNPASADRTSVYRPPRT